MVKLWCCMHAEAACCSSKSECILDWLTPTSLKASSHYPRGCRGSIEIEIHKERGMSEWNDYLEQWKRSEDYRCLCWGHRGPCALFVQLQVNLARWHMPYLLRRLEHAGGLTVHFIDRACSSILAHPDRRSWALIRKHQTLVWRGLASQIHRSTTRAVGLFCPRLGTSSFKCPSIAPCIALPCIAPTPMQPSPRR